MNFSEGLMKRLLPVLAAVMLAACAHTGTAPSADREIKTDSDQTDADRRAAIRLELAQGYFSRGQFNTALDELKLALQARPDMREAVNLRGLIYASMGDTQLAEDTFRRALSIYPNDPDTLHNYGWFMCQQQRWQTADALFDQAVAQSTYRAPARTLLAKGVCEARGGRMLVAEKTLSRAFELDPGSPVIAVNLSEVLFRNHELERARFYVKRVNDQPDQLNAQSLWLQLRIERKLGNTNAVDDLALALRRKFPQAPETQSLDAGRYDD
ncbi:type IV pilus biogenesis/stability protein PilW [Pelomonas cellulosilytica]|uniref:Type IV pilus biogenesis/stability protein PilW n=1 Tax=Pelomonas cellulosilytica TaxID=2906762 RepID=A0ABS8XPW2_9BURK|nr:type IV pilus biogenesis/stability protein PilW [Pelomonas sp. P8]MCE4553330.1 type IV pilus biogenesis/stability protein PilW [Pelomonas sp. P8]